MANSISIFLVDDHAVFRTGVRMLLETVNDFSILGEAGNGKEALALIEQLLPDVVILDWVMPGLNGLEVLKQLHKKNLHPRVIFLSMHGNEVHVTSAAREHASGYILKDDLVTDLVRSVRSATPESFYTSTSLSRHDRQT